MNSVVTKPHGEAIADVLARIRVELEEIATRIDRNQAVIARSTRAAGVNDADYVSAMQDADLSAQRIAGVAVFLRALGEETRPDWRVDTREATGALTLAGLARSIGAPGFALQMDETGAPGEVDLF